MGTGGVEKSAGQKNSPLSINDKTKKKKKVLVRVSTLKKFLSVIIPFLVNLAKAFINNE